MVTGAPSRRSEHKTRTKGALRTAALELFASQGYDDTTTEQIAERAGVSARTFFRYFPTKETVLWAGQADWIRAFTESFHAQPAEMNAFDAMCAAFVTAAKAMTRSRRFFALYERAVASSPTLRGRAHDYRTDDIAQISRAIADRRGLAEVDESSWLLASLGLLVYGRALEHWLAGPASADLGDLIEQGFAHLSTVFHTPQKDTR
jgi:AcrR family transcriptional regulator